MATIQTNRAIKKMKQAGFDRSDFRIRTDTKVKQTTDMIHGTRKYREYGDAIITVLNRDKVDELLSQILAIGLDVTIYHTDKHQDSFHIKDNYEDNGIIRIVDMTQEDEYGMHIRWNQIDNPKRNQEMAIPGKQEIVRVTIQITPTYKRQIWAQKISDVSYKVLDGGGELTGEIIIVTMPEHIINERKAAMNLHYAELEII